MGADNRPSPTVENVDLGTFWWAKAKAYERAVKTHCERTMQDTVDSYEEHAAFGDHDGDGFEYRRPPSFASLDLWEAFGVDWREVRDRTKPTKTADQLRQEAS